MQNDLSIEIEAGPEASPATVPAAGAFEALFRQHQHAVCSWILRISVFSTELWKSRE